MSPFQAICMFSSALAGLYVLHQHKSARIDTASHPLDLD